MNSLGFSEHLVKFVLIHCLYNRSYEILNMGCLNVGELCILWRIMYIPSISSWVAGTST